MQERFAIRLKHLAPPQEYGCMDGFMAAVHEVEQSQNHKGDDKESCLCCDSSTIADTGGGGGVSHTEGDVVVIIRQTSMYLFNSPRLPWF
jgi:hypothetical protein